MSNRSGASPGPAGREPPSPDGTNRQSAVERPDPQPDPSWGPASAWGRAAAADWSLDDVRQFLAAYGRVPAHLDAAPLPGGWENLNLRLDADGEQFVLRRYDVTAPDEVRWEIELVRFLTVRGFPTPALIERVDGEALGAFGGQPAALFAYVAGRHPRPDAPRAGETAATIVAELHLLTAGLALPYPRTRLDNRQRLQRFQAWCLARGVAGVEPGLRRLLDQTHEYGAEFAARLAAVEGRHGPLPHGVVHHDAHGNNLLFDDVGRLVALLDFDDAHETFLLADLAVLLNAWGIERVHYQFEPERARRVLAAYACRRSLSAAEWDLLPDAMALFNLADAASYVTGRIWEGQPADRAVADCGQYARFCERTATPDWRDRLRAQLALDR